MVCGTTSDSGKTTMVAALCRILHRQGVSVAPFKAQNMSLNSAVTADGHEIGRAQYLQAQAASVVPEVAMNPILLKPTGERDSQVVVMGRPVADMTAAEYHRRKPELLAMVMESLADLRSRFDVVLLEGAGSPTEINLLANDIVNLRIAELAGLNAVVVGDIDPGGVFASLYGTVGLLPDNLRVLVGGFVINKLRGDPTLLLDGTDQLEAACGVPTLGVVPMLSNLHLDAEDSVALHRPIDSPATATMDVAVIGYPYISNFTDVDALLLEPSLGVRFVRSVRELGMPDLVVLPGSKTTVADLAWLSERGLDRAIAALPDRTTILGICAGYQMLGHEIVDGIESSVASVDGLALLPVSTRFGPEKVLAAVEATAFGERVVGYQIHHGLVAPHDTHSGAEPWLTIDGRPDGVRSGRVFGTTVHGLFDGDGFRQQILRDVAERAGAAYSPGPLSPATHREAELDRLADHFEAHLDMAAIEQLIAPR